MNTAVFAYSRQGCETAKRVMSCLGAGQLRAYTMERFCADGFTSLPKSSRPVYQECFSWADVMVFVGSCGIAVREIAPFVKDKRTDPAVLAVDELGHFVIPLLSGHIGGANALASRLADGLGAIPVITTATDINGKFSVDAWAARQGYVISSMAAAKAVSAAILERDIPLFSDFPIGTALPGGVCRADSGAVGICISCRLHEPYRQTLRLIPPILHLGIGCRRGIQADAIRDAVNAALGEHGLDRRAVKCAASVDLKADEEGLLAFCTQEQLPIAFYTPGELSRVEGNFTSSAFVRDVTGVDNICERAALMGAKDLIVRKTAYNGVTVAIAAENLEVRFE